MELSIIKSILATNFTILFEETPKSNFKLVQKYIQKRRKKRVIAVSEIINRKARKCVPRRKQFTKTIAEMPDDIFYSHFHMRISTFKILYRMLLPLWNTAVTGRPGITLRDALYITLWKLVNQSSFREISKRFNIAGGSTYRSFIKIIRLIDKLKTKIITFPTDENDQERTMQGFEASRSHPFPFVLGCIGSTHIRIIQPQKGSVSFYNRTGTHSVIVQAVVDSEMKFTDVFVGYLGRCDDASIWKNGSLRNAIVNQLIRFPPECHLLGDAAYPLESCLMVPYEDDGCLTMEQTRFNDVLSSTRVVVEQAFGLLKKKFKILKYVEMTNFILIKYVIMSCFILHNIILENEGPNEVDSFANEVYSSHEASPNVSQLPPESDEAATKRNNLTTLLSVKTEEFIL